MQAISSSQSSPLVREYTREFIRYAPLRVKKNGHTGLSSSSIRNYTGFLNTWLRFEQAEKTTYGFDALDKKTIERYKKWLLGDCQYSINHAGRLLSLLKTLGLDAQKNDHPTHPYVNFIQRFSLPQRDKIIHTLSFAEMQQVVDTPVPLPLVSAKKWLIIGFGWANGFLIY